MANERQRLIDAAKLDILGYLEEFPICGEDKGWNAAVNSVFAHVVRAPTVDIIFCEECKYQEDCIRRIEFIGRNPVLKPNTYEYHPLNFCSCGERRCE